MSDLSTTRTFAPRVIHAWSREAIGLQLEGTTNTAYVAVSATNVWPTANLALLVPFYTTGDLTVARMWVNNGTTPASSWDIGIYTPAGTLVVSSGATVASGSAAVQEFNVTGTRLGAGRDFYLALMNTGNTGQVAGAALTNLQFSRLMGCQQVATAGTLVTGATLASCTFAIMPLFGLTTRAT